MLLETYTTDTADIILPSFIKIDREVTDEHSFSMFNLSFKDEYISEDGGNDNTSGPNSISS